MTDHIPDLPAVLGSIPFIHNFDTTPVYWWLDILWVILDLSDLQKLWRRIRACAKLGDVRIYDLRHTFASHGVAMGQGVPIIGKLFGHSQSQTTTRYAHIAANPTIEVAHKISERLASSLNPITPRQGDLKSA